MNYNDAFKIYYNEFLREYGERKIRSIQKTIENSKHTRSLLNQCYTKKVAPNATVLRQCMLSNIKLSFASKPIGIFAMALLLKKFDDEVNVNECIKSEVEIMEIFKSFNDVYNY